MPHFIAECTDNIREQADLHMRQSQRYWPPPASHRSAGSAAAPHWLEYAQMADGRQDYAFVHMTLKIGAGRSAEAWDVGDMLFALINPTSRR
ncbi:hypothetical protein MJ561_04260 [Klebsiella pneumoniae]|nr:hypothetical protein MJ561_04260 [Klebsiella pneumoniae]